MRVGDAMRVGLPQAVAGAFRARRVAWLTLAAASLALALSCRETARPADEPASGPAPATTATTAPAPLPTVEARVLVPAEVPAGTPIVVVLEGLVPEGARYWLTVIAPEQPDTAWGSWTWVEPGRTEASVPSPGPGRWEVRLHAHHGRVEAHVVARAPVRVGR